MGVHFPSVSTTTFIGPLPANNTETVVLTTPAINLSLDNAQVILHWFCNITAGASVTAHVFRLRRGTTVAGTLVGAILWSTIVTAATSGNSGGVYVDTPGAAAGIQYTLTVAQTAATAAGTFNDGALLAYVL